MARHKTKKIRYLIEYACLRAILRLFDLMSPTNATRSAERLADLWYILHASRRRIARKNILQSGITNNEKEAGSIARASFRHFAVLLVETMKSSSFLTENTWQERTELVISPETTTLLKDPERGVIVISGHIGSWEIAAQLLSYFKPISAIARGLNNPYADKLMNEKRTHERLSFISKYDNALSRAKSVIKNGQILAIISDQHARKGGIMIDFFRKPASTYPTAALLHLATGAPICFVHCIRTRPGFYRLTVLDPITHKRSGNNESDITTILGKINHELEEIIRKYPEQYLWGHRRWRVQS